MKASAIESAWKGIARCEHCAVRSLALFGDLRAEDFNLIHLPIDEIEFAPGITIYSVADPAPAVFTLRSGLVKLVQYLPDGHQRIVGLVSPGGTFGMEALVGRPYAHTAVVLETALVCRIPRPVIDRLRTETPRLHGALMERWQSALDEAHSWLTELSTGKAPQRFARLLLRTVGADGTAPMFPREDLGAMLAITTEHASRTVAEFRRAGAITPVTADRCRCNRTQLEAIATADG